MSDNWSQYMEKMAELRLARTRNRPLQGQFEELVRFVYECESRWPADAQTERDVDPTLGR